jgi:hypothetical protein
MTTICAQDNALLARPDPFGRLILRASAEIGSMVAKGSGPQYDAGSARGGGKRSQGNGQRSSRAVRQPELAATRVEQPSMRSLPVPCWSASHDALECFSKTPFGLVTPR